MEKNKAYFELRRLVVKYILSDKEKEKLLNILSDEHYIPPVRGVIDDIFNNSSAITKEDKEIIDDLMYFFG